MLINLNKFKVYSILLIEAPTRFELVIKVLQTSALPLGYGAIFTIITALYIIYKTIIF